MMTAASYCESTFSIVHSSAFWRSWNVHRRDSVRAFRFPIFGV